MPIYNSPGSYHYIRLSALFSVSGLVHRIGSYHLLSTLNAATFHLVSDGFHLASYQK